jgi:MIP family channel proteins
MRASLGTRLAAEALGTFFFFFLGFSGIAVVLQGGLDAIEPVGVAAGFGFGLVVAIAAFGHTSGGHYNPAVSAGLFVAGRFPGREVIPYWLAQLVGGLCAVGTMALVFGDEVSDGLGTVPGVGVDDWGALLLEAIVTALLVMVILTVTASEGAAWREVMAPLLIGLVIFTGAVTVGPSSGGSFNPARSLAPAVYDGNWSDMWIYLAGPFAGAIVGGAAWSFLIARGPTRVTA